MGVLFGFLLIELKVYGVFLRAPVISFLLIGRKYWFKAALMALFCISYALIVFDLESVVVVSKLNIFTFCIIVFGAWTMMLLSISKSFPRARILNAIKFMPFFFLLLSVMQVAGLGFWIPYFSDRAADYYPRTSGLSSEPSFFANMIFYFLVLFFGCCQKNQWILSTVFLLLFLSTSSWTVTIYFLVTVFVLSLFKIKYREFRSTPLFVLFIIPFLLVFIERFYSIIIGSSMVHDFFQISSSWREVSLFSSIYGAQLFGPFSGGENWGLSLLAGQSMLVAKGEIISWVVWPWSMFSMLLSEIGIFPTFVLILAVGKKLNRIWYEKPSVRKALVWYTASISIGFYFAPKWCIYFFFFPLFYALTKSNKNSFNKSVKAERLS